MHQRVLTKRPRDDPSDDDDAVVSGTAVGPVRLPKLEGSSRSEIDFVAHVGEMLHSCGLMSAPLTMDALAGWLVDGKDALQTDSRFRFDLPATDVLLEYDPPVYHGIDDVDRDIKKTLKLGTAYPDAIVMRVRVATVPLPPFANEHVHIVDVPRPNTCTDDARCGTCDRSVRPGPL